MLKRSVFFSLVLAMAGCGKSPQNQTNVQNRTNGSGQMDCTPIQNPNYTPNSNQPQFYYPDGCQNTNAQNGTNGYNNGYNNGTNNNGTNVGGYLAAGAVGAAAGALANRAYQNKQNRANPPATGNIPPVNTANNRATANANSMSNTARAGAPTTIRSTNSNFSQPNLKQQRYTPTQNRSSSVYRSSASRGYSSSRR